MQQFRLRFTVRSVLGVVASFAVLMTLVRFVEQAHHRGQVKYWERQEKQWRDAYAEALQAGQSKSASMYEGLEDSCIKQRIWHEGQLGGFPRTFSRTSAFLTLMYVWAVALCIVVRSERLAGRRTACPASHPRSRPSSFIIWVGLGFISPVSMMALGILFERKTPYSGPLPWPASVIEGLLWIQLVHALLGVIVLRGRRWAALGCGTLSVLVTGWVALHCSMSVTGVWL